MVKFRGKRADNGEWVKGLPIRYPADATKVNAILLDDYYENDFGMVCGHVEKVDPSTVSMGVEIGGKWCFEGDIVNAWGGEYCQGVWERSCHNWEIKDFIADWYELCFYDDFEIVGTKWDNPELLGGQNEQV